MNTLQFFQATLPATGPYFGVLFTPAKVHISCATLEDLVRFVDKHKDDERVTVYHACVSYQHPFVMVPHARKSDELVKGYRKQPNWSRAKSFWLDIDCTPDKAEAGEGYVDKQAGYAALVIFCAKVGLPRPMVVDSGNGLHAYWPLTRDIGPNSWVTLATALKALAHSLGFLADPSRTSDFASILRPVGTVNRKHGDTKSVVVRRECEPISPEDFSAAIKGAVDKFDVLAATKSYTDTSVNEDMLAHVPESVPSSAVLAASKCKQLAQVKDTQGDVSYHQWFGAIGIIVHSTEGRELAHEWSARRAETGHTTVDADERFDTWNAGPTTCEKFSEANPEGCAGCEYAGTIKSPILLGRIAPEQAESEAKVEVDGEQVTVQVPALPKDYAFGKDGSTIRYITDKAGIVRPLVFTPVMLYATHRVVSEMGSYGIALRAHLPRGKVREFVISTSTLEAPNELAKALGDKEIVTSNHEKARHHMTAYLKDSLRKLMEEADEINTLTSYGWHYDMQAFLLGDKLFHRDGTVRKVLLGGYAADVAQKAFPKPVGTAEGYAQALNDIYARPGMEPLQYAIASVFGSLLTPLGENSYKGLLLALTGKSGKGKSTACQAALYAFGEAEAMTIAGNKQVGATENGRWAMLGGYRNIPILFDETTNMQAEELSQLAYTVSQGLDKQRLTSTPTGVRMAARQAWRMSPMVTANNDIHLALSGMQSNTEAESVRIVQIRTERYNMPVLSEAEVPSAVEQMCRNKGVAGELFVRHIVTNLADVESLWRHTMAEVTKLVPGSKFRFYRNHAACTLTALQITNELRITEFNYGVLFDFAIKLMQGLSEEVDTDNVQTPKDAFMRMVNELMPRIILTNEYRDGRDKAGPEEAPRIHGAIAGRYISGTGMRQDAYAGHLYLTKRDFKTWCGTNRVSPNEIEEFLRSQAAWMEVPAKFLFTRGTNLPMLQSPCIGVDMSRVNGVMLGKPKLVVPDADEGEDGGQRANMGG